MNKGLFAGVAFAALLVAAAPASADIIQVDASSIQGDNVLFNDGTQTGAEVFGTTNNGTNTVRFTGTTTGGGNVIRANGGQAVVEGNLNAATSNPNDTLFLTGLQFGLLGGKTFNNLEFNLFGGTATSATFNFIDNAGDAFTFTNALVNGSNFFGFQGINGQSIRTASLSLTGGGIQDIRQVRLDATPAVMSAVPEPTTWAFMLVGFGAVGYSMRRKDKTNVRFAAA